MDPIDFVKRDIMWKIKDLDIPCTQDTPVGNRPLRPTDEYVPTYLGVLFLFICDDFLLYSRNESLS